MNLKQRIFGVVAPLLVGLALTLPASAQTSRVGNQFDLGDIIGIGGNNNGNGGGINTQAIISLATILYQLSQQNQNNNGYPEQYPPYGYPGQQQYPGQQNPGQYPNQPYPSQGQYPYPGQQYPANTPGQQYPAQNPYPAQYPYQY